MEVHSLCPLNSTEKASRKASISSRVNGGIVWEHGGDSMIVLPLCLPTLIFSFSNKPRVLQLRVCFMGNLTYEGKWWLLTGICTMADETLYIVFFFLIVQEALLSTVQAIAWRRNNHLKTPETLTYQRLRKKSRFLLSWAVPGMKNRTIHLGAWYFHWM